MHEHKAAGTARQREPGDWARLRVEVAALDPLGLDNAFRRLPHLSGPERTRWALVHLRKGVSGAATGTADLAGLHATLRDLGVLAATLRAQGIEPTTAWPALGPLLSRIGTATAHVPRDTILHYSAFNPTGDRRRRYSAEVQEEVLIDAVTTAADAVIGAGEALWRASGTRMGSAEFLEDCDVAHAQLTHLVTAMSQVAERVAPQFFASTLRPHWESIIVCDRRYDGVGPAQLPIYIVDELLWAARARDIPYRMSVDHNLPYTLAEFRHRYGNTQGVDSLTATYRRLTGAGDTPVWADRVRSSLLGMLGELARFRKVHHAFAVRTSSLRYATDPAAPGSGHGPELMAGLLRRLTEEARDALRATPTRQHLSAA